MIVSRMTVVLLEIVSVFIVARLDINTLSAYGLAAPLYMTLYMLTCSFLLVFLVKAAQLFNDKERFSRYFSASVWISLMLSVVVIVLILACGALLPLLGQSKNISGIADQFFYFIVFGMPPLYLSSVLSQTLIIFEKTHFVSISAFLQLLLGAVLVYAFTHFWGWDLKGVALGFDIAYWTRCLMLMGYIKFCCAHKVKLVKCNKNDFIEDAKFLFRMGWPTSIQYGGELVGASIATLMIGHFYVYALAAQQIASQFRIFLIMLPYALSQATAIMIAKKSKSDIFAYEAHVRQVMKSAFYLGMTIIALLVFPINIFSGVYIHLFIANGPPAVTHLAKIFIVITSIALFFDMAKYLLSGALRGMHSTKGTMLSSIIGYCLIGTLLAALIGYYFKGGPVGIRIGMLIGLAISVCITARYFSSFMKKMKIVGT